eukprot:Pgem_evm2s19094
MVLWRMQTPLIKTDTKEAENRLQLTRGHLVEFPENFLEKEYLGPTLVAREFYVPVRTFQ